jgi:opacity protein-like surface antigen
MKNKCKKKIILLLLASASAGQFGLPVPVSLAQEQFSAAELLPYFRIDFGQAHFFPVKGLPNAVGNKKLHSATNSVVSAGLGLGINFGDKFRSDITWVRHLDPVLKATNNNGEVVKRKPLIDAYFLNLYYEIASKVSIFNPYIGAGVGLARVRDNLSSSLIGTDDASRAIRQAGLYNWQKSSQKIFAKNNFAYKFVIGSSFDLNENVKFDLAYNYHDYGKTKSALDSRKNQIGKTHYRAHVVSAGLRFGM